MKLKVVCHTPLSRLVKRMGYAAVAFGLWCFLSPDVKNPSQKLLNHENIHLYQQAEMLFIFQWLWYGIEYLVKRVKYKSHDAAYKNLSFEREAYNNDDNLEYLKARKRFAWFKYL